MANEQSGVKFFVILTVVCLATEPYLTLANDDEGSPILDIMQALLKDTSQGQSNSIGMILPLIQGFLQNGGGKQLGDILGGAGKKSNTLNLLSGLGTLLQNRKTKRNADSEGGFDPAMLGTVLELFSSLNQAQGGSDSDEEVKSNKVSGRKDESQNSIDWEPILSVVGSAVSSMVNQDSDKGKEAGGSGMEALLSFLPVLMSSFSGQHVPHAGNVKHHDHEPFLPPFLENIHEYWDHFTSSQFGRTLWENSGLSALTAQFQDESGNFNSALFFESLEKASLRRRWIHAIASFVAEWTNHISNAETQKKYLDTVEIVTNGYLQAEGYPKNALLDFKKAGDSISALIDEAFKRQLSLNVASAQYVKPAIEYFQGIFGASQKAGYLTGVTAQSIETKLSKSLEKQLVEPVLRANRAYRFALRNKSCSKYVLCVVSETGPSKKQEGMRPAVVKTAGLVTAWFLSGAVDLPFFEIAAVEGDCRKYDDNCSAFHEEDSLATTEYFHNEL